MKYKRWAHTPAWWRVWYYLTRVYWGFYNEGRQIICYTPLFSLSWHDGSHTANVDALEWGWRVYFWPTFPDEGGYLYKYKWERVERVLHSRLAQMSVSEIRERALR